MLKKYLNGFTECITDAVHAASNLEIEPNIFDTQEVFEIENVVDDKNEDSTKSEKEKLELFPTLQLYIPLVSNSVIKKLKIRNENGNSSEKTFFFLPGVVDLSFWCSPVRDQGSLNSCTAFAAIALLEYFANRNYQQKINPSALFLYKTARKKMNVTGDVGASIRETIKVLALFGVPPEDSWSYDEDKVDEEPPPYCYAYAQNYKTLKYFLLDYPGISKESLLFQIKAVLAAGFPCIFGFTLYASAYEDSNEPGHIPYPDQKNDKVVGGHTAVVVGYNDYKFMLCADRKHYSQGAFLIRNSWGPEWGVKGYGWIPYDYVLAGLTAAWWSLLKSEWFNEDNFGLAGTGGKEGHTGTIGSDVQPKKSP
ncbi:MAG: C1 family peptidase [Spirirestis rafaelensis WJT71-NPBG6]|nr:C1 family peptidase [Spirirestis rafaelensis WJT71-NPBG6]